MLERDTENTPIVSLVSLGCAKNTVDSERVLGMFVEDGWMIASDPGDSDICLVNTCGFIEAARTETEEVLRELSDLKSNTRLRAVFALGCMVERANEVSEQSKTLADADLLISFRDYPRLPKLCREYIMSVRSDRSNIEEMEFEQHPRVQTGYAHHAYLKISEGCSNRCSFCTIPSIRGPQRSVPIELLVQEASSLIDMKARELEIIAQDTTSYGCDLYGKRSLPRLLRALAKIDSDCWFRIMYAFPPFLDDEVLEIIAGDQRFCRYIDIPLQHISDPILKAMGRGMGKSQTIELLDRIQFKIPEVALRTTFIVGYPGETEDQFLELLEFVREGRFMHAGVFTYSREVNTRAAREKDALSENEKRDRADALMEAQLDVSCRRLDDMVGGETIVMLDRWAENEDGSTIGVGHTQQQEIDVDGAFLLKGVEADRVQPLQPGDKLKARITDSYEYDLEGVPI